MVYFHRMLLCGWVFGVTFWGKEKLNEVKLTMGDVILGLTCRCLKREFSAEYTLVKCTFILNFSNFSVYVLNIMSMWWNTINIQTSVL